MSYYFKCIKNYVNFSGRARRKEYWMFVLMNMIFGFIIGLISTFTIPIVLPALYSLFVFLPSLAVCIRRLHDTGHSGWWLLIGIIPLIGAIVLFIFYCTDGQPGENKWGVNPKEEQYA